jgi:hypothetical protein
MVNLFLTVKSYYLGSNSTVKPGLYSRSRSFLCNRAMMAMEDLTFKMDQPSVREENPSYTNDHETEQNFRIAKSQS